MPRHPRSAFAIVALLLLAAPAWSQETGPGQDPERSEAKVKTKAQRARRDAPGTYMGRRIAPVMSYMGAEWLIRETRIEEEQPDMMLDALQFKAGDVVADIGAGVGYTSERIARRVGPTGKVLATDIQPQMLTMLKDRMKQVGVSNVQAILCTQTDTKLPEGQIDLAIMVDVYHEASQPEALLQGILKGLKPGGRLVLVEFRGEDPEVPIRPEHKMTLQQVRKEVEPQGYVYQDSLEFLPWQHVIIFKKPVAAVAEPSKEPIR